MRRVGLLGGIGRVLWLVGLLLAAAAGSARAAAGLEQVHELTLTWVGDMAFSSDRGLPAGGVEAAFRPLAPYLHSDYVTGNLEGTLATGGRSKCGGGAGGNCFAFRAPPFYARGLRQAGFDLLNLANNHANDYGAIGQAQTAAALRGASLRYAGRPGQITTVIINGARVAFLGFAPYPWAAPLLDIVGAERPVG